MLSCSNCGQCIHISDDPFIQYASVSGTETRYLDPENGEVVDYGDSDIESTGDSDTACPHCESNNVDFDWNGDEQEALNLRKEFDDRRKKISEERERERVAESDWDLTKNKK